MKRNKSIILHVLAVFGLLCILFMLRHQSYAPTQLSANDLNDTSDDFISQWHPRTANYDEADIKEALMISRMNMGIMPGDYSFVKVKKIANHLISTFHSKLGTPADSLFEISALRQYKALQNPRAELYCTQYSAMFAFFSRVNGLYTREIECYGSNDRHIFNETYIPEAATWVYTDLTHNIIFITDSNRLLPFTSVYRNIQGDGKIQSVVYTIFGDTTVTAPFESFRARLAFSFDRNAVFYYLRKNDHSELHSIKAKLSRYFLDVEWYYLYSDKQQRFTWFYIKYIVFGIVILLSVNAVRLISGNMKKR